MRIFLCICFALFAVFFVPIAAQAQTCSATISPINFGAISVRAGAVNETSGIVTVECTGAPVSPVGVCIRLGDGSGGAGSNNSPRYLSNGSGGQLSYQLRPNGNASSNGTWNEVFVLVPVALGSGSASIPIYASITSNTVAVDAGNYTSAFSGPSDARITYGVASCLLLASDATIPDFTVSADVVASCELNVSAMNFGSLNTQVINPVLQTANINVACTDNTNYSVTLSQGQGGGSGPADRKLKNGGAELSYGLYQDANRAVPWGDLATNDVDATGIGANQSFTVYGKIHVGQSAQFGTYTDNVVVTVVY